MDLLLPKLQHRLLEHSNHGYSLNNDKDSLYQAVISTLNDSMGYLLVPDNTENWIVKQREVFGVTATNLRGGSLSSKRERRWILLASLGETATSVERFAVSVVEIAASLLLEGRESRIVVVSSICSVSCSCCVSTSSTKAMADNSSISTSMSRR